MKISMGFLASLAAIAAFSLAGCGVEPLDEGEAAYEADVDLDDLDEDDDGEAVEVVESELAALSFDDGFEKGLPTDKYKISMNGKGIVDDSTAKKSEGKRSLHTRIVKKGSTNYRSEVVVKSPTDKVAMKGSPDYWFGCSIYVPSSSTLKADSVLVQWHTHAKSGVSPVIGLRIREGKWIITREVGDRKGAELGSVSTNKWTDFVFRIRWRVDKTGLLQVWKNGKRVVDMSKIQTGWEGEAKMPYLKVGRYSASFQYTKKVSDGEVHESFHDALRIALKKDAYDLVAPR